MKLEDRHLHIIETALEWYIDDRLECADIEQEDDKEEIAHRNAAGDAGATLERVRSILYPTPLDRALS